MEASLPVSRWIRLGGSLRQPGRRSARSSGPWSRSSMSPGCVGFHPSSSRMTALEAGMSAARKPASQAKCSPSSSSATQTTRRWEMAADDLGDVADRNALVGAHRLTHGGVHGGDTRRRRGQRRPLLLGHDNRHALASEGRAVEMDELRQRGVRSGEHNCSGRRRESRRDRVRVRRRRGVAYAS